MMGWTEPEDHGDKLEIRRPPYVTLSFDASTTAVGWAKTEDGAFAIIALFEPSNGPPNVEPWVYRVALVEAVVENLIREHNPDAIFYEIPTGDRGNMATNRKLGAVEYVIARQAFKYEVRTIGVTASQVKATGCHKGVLDVAAALAGRPVSGDEADAMGVFFAGDKIVVEERLAKRIWDAGRRPPG